MKTKKMHTRNLMSPWLIEVSKKYGFGLILGLGFILLLLLAS